MSARTSVWIRRDFALLAGLALVAVALAPPLAAWAHHDLRGHMVQHLLLGMFAPLALVLGAPLTRLLRVLPPVAARALVRALHSAPGRLWTHPFFALLLNTGGMYLLYLSPLYAASLHDPALHYFVHFHFLAAGYLFSWAVLAWPDASPRSPGLRVRLAALFLSMALHGLLAKLMYGYRWPRGAAHDAAEIEAAAQLMYYGGDLAELLLAAALFARWYVTTGERPRAVTVGAPAWVRRWQ